MSAKYKPKRKEAEPIVDDWEASDMSDAANDYEGSSNKATTSTLAAASNNVEEKRQHQEAWGEEENNYLRAAASSSAANLNGRSLWEEA